MARVVLERVYGPEPGSFAVRNTVRFRGDGGDALDTGGPITLPADFRTTLASAIAGNTSSQAANFVSNVGMPSMGYVIVDANTPKQEVVQASFVSGTSYMGVFRRAHNIGATVELVKSSFSKTFRVVIQSPPTNYITAIRFSRPNALSPGVYDQYRVVSVYTGAAEIPWVSDADEVYSPVSSDPMSLSVGPYNTSGIIPDMLEIQWLFSGAVRHIDANHYRIAWDES